MTGQRIEHVRVSTVKQNIGRQLEGIELDRIFTDKASGKDVKRPRSARGVRKRGAGIHWRKFAHVYPAS